MSKLYYILDTEQEADTCRQLAYQAHMAEHASENYKNITTGWCEITQRVTDGKYIVPYCDHLGHGSYVIESSEPEWFSVERPYGL